MSLYLRSAGLYLNFDEIHTNLILIIKLTVFFMMQIAVCQQISETFLYIFTT